MKTLVDLTFVLVDAAREENVGATARAIKTMGFSKLAFVRGCNHLGDMAQAVAHASIDILRNAELFDTTAPIFERFDFVIGTTADERDFKRQPSTPEQLLKHLNSETGGLVGRGAILFGSEDRGLANEDLERCDLLATIAMAQPYPAINLGQSAMIFAYELGKVMQHDSNIKQYEQTSPGPSEFRILRSKVECLLSAIELPTDHKAYGRLQDFVARLSREDGRLVHYLLGKIDRQLKSPLGLSRHAGDQADDKDSLGRSAQLSAASLSQPV